MRTTPTKMTTLTRLLVAGALPLMMAHSSFAQSTLSPTIVESTTINASQGSQITSFISQWTQQAQSDDSTQASRAQSKLVEPLINNRVSISFRQAYSDALNTYFDQLGSSSNMDDRFVMLRLAGELGTARGSSIIMDGLGSDDLGTQVFSIGRAGRVLRTTGHNGAALPENDLNKLINRVGEIASSSDDSTVINACIDALGQGANLPSDDFKNARAMCVAKLCDAAVASLDNDASEFSSQIRTAMASSGIATNSLLQIGEDSTSDAVRSSVELGAQMISVVFSQVIDGSMPSVDDRALQIAVLQAGESLLHFALREHAELRGKSAGSVKQTDLATVLESGEDRQFRNQAALLLGPGSDIVTDFNFKDDQFIN